MSAIRIIDDHLELANIGSNTHAQIDTYIAAADNYVKRDGSLALTADWDIGGGRKILADEIRARDGAGLKLTEDGGKGLHVTDGGNVQIGSTPAYAFDRNLKILDDGVTGQARVSLVGTSGLLSPAVEFVIDGNISKRGLVMLIAEGSNDYGIYFYATNNDVVGLKGIISGDGKYGINTNAPTAYLDVNSDIIRLRTAKTPASAGAAGNQGDWCWDADYFYICVSTNTWERTPHAWDINVYDDAAVAKLAGIDTGATKYPDTGEQAFLDADHTKLDGIKDGAIGGSYILAATDTPTLIKNRADAICSSTSAETEINAAFATYDTVKLTEGTFIIDGSITPGEGQSLIGSGPGSVIKIKDSFNAYIEAVFIYNVSNTLVSNLTLDGNRANQTSGDMYGIVWYTATHTIISNCWINNFRKDAMRARTDCKYGVVANCIFDNNNYGPSIESDSKYITVHNCIIRRSQYSGLYISSASHISFKNNVILESSQITNNTWNDIKIEGGGGSDPVTDIDIQSNTIRAGEQTNKSKYAIEVNNSNCTRILITNNDCYGTGVTGTFLDNGTSTNWGAGNRKKNGTWATGT